jgi:hypothetical protein
VADLSEAQRKRQEARRRRRGQSEEDAQEHGSAPESGEQPLDSVKQAAKVAAATAAVGAAAAAARALTHRDDQGEEDGESARLEPEQEERKKGPGDQESEEQPEPQQEPQLEQEQEPQPQGQEQEEQAPAEGAELGDARETMQRAREQLEELLGKPVESASSLERTHDGWLVTLEVVELKRIPESTDILAAYELELDESLGFRRYQQVRRYTRSQADRGDQ